MSSFGLDDFLKQINVKQTQNQGQLPENRKLQRKLAQKMSIKAFYASTIPEVLPVKDESAPSLKEILSQNNKSPREKPQAKNAGNEQPQTTANVVKYGTIIDLEDDEAPSIFQNRAFVFIPYGLAFTKKQIEILSENIRKRGGKTFEFSFFDWKPLSFVELLIVTSAQMPYKILLETVAADYHEQIKLFTFIDHEWITKCIYDGVVTDFGSFTIKWVLVVEPEKEEKKKVRDIYATRHQTRGGPSAFGKRLKRNQQNTEALDQFLEEERLELEAVSLEAELLMQPIKKVKGNNQILDSSRYLFDFCYKGSISLKNSQEMIPESPKTEILSSDDEVKPQDQFDLEEETKDTYFSKSQGQNTNKKISDFNVRNAGISSEIKVIEEFDEFKFPDKGDFSTSDIIIDSDDDEIDEEIQLLRGEKPKVTYDEDTILKGIELLDSKQDIKQYKTFNPLNKQKAKYWDDKNYFVCQTGSKMNYNKLITDELEKLEKVYTNEKDLGRMCAYRKAAAVIRAVPFRIASAGDVKNIRGIGDRIKEKIQEIVTTGRLKKADFLTVLNDNDEKQLTIQTLTQVWGIGVQTAVELFKKGIKTVNELYKHQNLLNDNQKVGLRYFEDLKQRMNRDEVAQIVKIVSDKIEEIAEVKNTYEAICCGSYRRGKQTCGDIDILITRRDGKSFAGFLPKLIKSLENSLLTDHLMWPKGGTYGNETYMGVCRNGGLYRRIDIKIYPREQFGYALVHFTGNDYFNRSMRLLARKKGMTLSDHGFFPSIRKKQEKIWTGQTIPCYTEEDVFKALGIQYRPPTEREV